MAVRSAQCAVAVPGIQNPVHRKTARRIILARCTMTQLSLAALHVSNHLTIGKLPFLCSQKQAEERDGEKVVTTCLHGWQRARLHS